MARWILAPRHIEAEFRARHMILLEDLEATGAIDYHRGIGALPGGRR